MPGTPEPIDSGATDTDGQHIVGDDSAITVDGAQIYVAYQDATSGVLRVSSRSTTAPFMPPPAASPWSKPTILKQEGKFSGFFPQHIKVGGKAMIANWWRVTTPEAITGDVTLLPRP